MKITQKTIDIIRSSVVNLPAETGGILVSQNGVLISDVIMDTPNNDGYRCCYAPNVKYFNECISDWQKQNKSFFGIFHTHFYNVKTLSNEDIKYINAIMSAMPKEINRLFFPIYILPRNEMICYEATREGNNISIKNDILEII